MSVVFISIDRIPFLTSTLDNANLVRRIKKYEFNRHYCIIHKPFSYDQQRNYVEDNLRPHSLDSHPDGLIQEFFERKLMTATEVSQCLDTLNLQNHINDDDIYKFKQNGYLYGTLFRTLILKNRPKPDNNNCYMKIPICYVKYNIYVN